MAGVPMRLAALAMLCGMLGACSHEPAPAPAPATKALTSAEGTGLSVSFKVDPDPPRAGDNKLEVHLTQAGAPVVDAAVTAVFYMPAMPSMNMPEMRSTFPLQPVGGGIYRGNGKLIMGGTWNVTVTASRADAKLGSDRFTVIAK